MSIKRIPAAVDRSSALDLGRMAEQIVREIYNDYFSGLDEQTFQTKHLGNTSLVMKLAAYRFAGSDVIAPLLKAARSTISEIYGVSDAILHPIFYLRIGYPGLNYSAAYRTAFLDSQPHYDRSFSIDAFSFWTALVDIDDDTGGLAEFCGDEVSALFPLERKNRLNYNLYLETARGIDPVLRRSCKTFCIDAGDMLTFDSSVLHGATKPISRKRISFDFRLVPIAAVASADAAVKAKFDAVNGSIDLSNARNLAYLGDTLGANRILLKLGLKPEPHTPRSRIQQPYSEMRWQDEYAYLATLS
jgi:hypothetical protein